MKIPKNRLNHMIGVAEYMYDNAEKYNVDKETAYLFGLLHDIGYLSGEALNHEMYGGYLISKNISNCVNDFDTYIRQHGIPINELLILYNNKLPPILHLLLEADMSIDINGNNVSYNKRLEDIGNRHTKESKAYIQSKKLIEWLKEN